MGRHSPKGQLVVKRDRKLEVVYRALPPQSSMDAHLAKFIELYPADWQTLVYRYQEHARHLAAGQRPAMLEPRQHLLHIVKQYYRKTNKVVARSTSEAQPEAVTEHPEPEAVTEHPQPEA